MDVFNLDPLKGLGLGEGGGTFEIPFHTSLAEVAGPFFLGFSFQFFGMGIVLMLSIHYFGLVASETKTRTEASTSTRMGVTLVVASLVSNLAQSIVDMIRGWEMFATNFMNIQAFLTPTSSFFLSPFFGLFPAIITQFFLLRRCLLFISSLAAFWPKLAHPITRWAFGILMGVCILFGNSSGVAAAVYILRSPNLWSLGRAQGSAESWSPFQMTELSWLTTSSAVDVVLSVVLCVELWWARAHLAAKGGPIGQAVTRLILITFHGGLAVTTIQLTTLFLYQFAKTSSWCYFPILSLPKFYTITLILSLSLPHTHGSNPGASHVFSLPTILTGQAPSPLPPSPPPSHRSLSPIPVSPNTERIEKSAKRKSLKSVKSMQGTGAAHQTLKKGWRKSQDWIGWSMSHEKQAPKEVDDRGTQRWIRQEDDQRVVVIDRETVNDYRRPSEPNSLAPLLSPSSRRPSSVMPFNSRRDSLWGGEILTDISPTQQAQFAGIDHRLTPTLPQPFESLSTLPPSITVERAHSFSDRRRSLPAHGYIRQNQDFGVYDQPGPDGFSHHPNLSGTSAASQIRSISVTPPRARPPSVGRPHMAPSSSFSTGDPFATVRDTPNTRRGSMPDVSPTKKGPSRPALSPLSMTQPGTAGDIPLRSISVPGSGELDQGEDRGPESSPGLRARRGGTRMFSFEDMLANGPGDDLGK